jgi:hypothetical protein
VSSMDSEDPARMEEARAGLEDVGGDGERAAISWAVWTRDARVAAG